MQAVATLAGFAFESHYRQFLNVGRLQIVGFDFLGIDILAIAQNDHFFFSPGEEQVAVRVEVTEVAGEKPAVAQDCCGRVGTVPVTFHHDRAS